MKQLLCILLLTLTGLVLLGATCQTTVTEDMLDWMMADPQLSSISHLTGVGAVPKYTYWEPTKSRFWWVKSTTGYGWDLKTYDQNYIYDKFTEQVFNDPTSWKDHIPGGMGYPISPRLITYDPTAFGVKLAEIDTPVANFTIHNGETSPGTCNGTTSNSQLGHVKAEIWGPYLRSFGGSLAPNTPTLELAWYWSCDVNYSNCAVKEIFSLQKYAGQVQWTTSNLIGGVYVEQQKALDNTITNGVNVPLHPCFN